MSLPTISTLNTVQDTNKQLAAIRSYLIQLKDELEAELSNVTYDMLSVPLQKKIDAISEDIAANKIQQDITAQYISAQFAQVNELVADTLVTAELYADDMKAEAISAGEIYAGQMKAEAISASEAYARSVVANKVTADEVRSIVGEFDYVTATEVNSQIASFGYVTASGVTSVIANSSSISTNNIHVRNAIWLRKQDNPTDEAVISYAIRMTVGGAARYVACTSN